MEAKTRILTWIRIRIDVPVASPDIARVSDEAPQLTSKLLEDAVRKMPRQGRSLASYERMLSATRELLLERGDDDFTLLDVSERGGVSIGSIYLRFDGKDKLLQAVIGQELIELAAAECKMLERIGESSSNLTEFLESYIALYSEFLEDRAKMLGLIMQKAATDEAISGPGKEIARHSAACTTSGILRFRDEIRADDPELKARVVFQTIFATVARQFGLATTAEAADDELWAIVKQELAKMMLSYLRDPN